MRQNLSTSKSQRKVPVPRWCQCNLHAQGSVGKILSKQTLTVMLPWISCLEFDDRIFARFKTLPQERRLSCHPHGTASIMIRSTISTATGPGRITSTSGDQIGDICRRYLKPTIVCFDPHRGCARPSCSTTPSAGPPQQLLFIIFKLHLLIKYVRVCTFSQILLLPPSQVWCFRELQPTLAVIWYLILLQGLVTACNGWRFLRGGIRLDSSFSAQYVKVIYTPSK